MRAGFLALGFGIALLPPALLTTAVAFDLPWLPVAVLLGATPLARAIFGDAPSQWPEWTERTASVLHALPVLLAVAHMSAALLVISSMDFMNLSVGDAIAWALSLWAVWLFASCASHELLHAGRPVNRLGQMLAGMIGHPMQEHEHRMHHSRASSEDLHEAPRIESSLWAFTWARLRILPGNAWASNAAARARTGGRGLGDLGWSLGAFAATAALFGCAGGWIGLAMYLAIAFLTCWAVQAVQYLQHWGLGQESIGERGEPVAWEDRCLVQAWLTLCTTYHQAHHAKSRTPFYRLAPLDKAPRMPGGYVVLLIVSFVPMAWRWLMLPALEQWRNDPANQRSAGRTLICFTRPVQD